MSGGKGLLLVLVDPAPTLEEELNDWYDTEHLPERAALPGFETALRFTALGDGPRYAAIYDLATIEVLESDAYRAVSGDNFSPWTRRVTGRTHPLRITARQAAPGDRVTGRCSRLLLLRFRDTAALPELAKALDGAFSSKPGYLQSRLFACAEPDPESALAMVEFSGAVVPDVDPGAFGTAGRTIDLAATYRPYRA